MSQRARRGTYQHALHGSKMDRMPASSERKMAFEGSLPQLRTA